MWHAIDELGYLDLVERFYRCYDLIPRLGLGVFYHVVVACVGIQCTGAEVRVCVGGRPMMWYMILRNSIRFT